jgi:hypothetical protein
MSKIVLVASEKTLTPKALVELQRCTKRTLSDLQSSAASGRPVYVGELFLNDHDDIANTLRSIIALSASANFGLNIFELEPEEVFETALFDDCRIEVDTLHNLLTEWDKRR